MALLISVLIVYGLTLILVQGSIFTNWKNKVNACKTKLHAFLYPQDEELNELILNNDKSLDPKLMGIYTKLSQDVTNEKVVPVLKNTIQSIKKNVVQKRQSLWNKTKYAVLDKFYTLINCMMCSSFWVGLFICLISMYFNINLFGHPLWIVTSYGVYNTIVSVFITCCMFSGTTWIIHTVVDLLDELKNKVN